MKKAAAAKKTVDKPITNAKKKEAKPIMKKPAEKTVDKPIANAKKNEAKPIMKKPAQKTLTAKKAAELMLTELMKKPATAKKAAAAAKYLWPQPKTFWSDATWRKNGYTQFGGYDEFMDFLKA